MRLYFIDITRNSSKNCNKKTNRGIDSYFWETTRIPIGQMSFYPLIKIDVADFN